MNAITHIESRPLVVPAARAALEELQAVMLALPEDQKLGFENRHDFCPGIYARTIFMKAGLVYMSRIHKTRHFFVVAAGSCHVVAADGSRKLIAAPYLGVTELGTQRALHIIEDCIWTTFHPTDLTDPEEIGRKIMADSFEQFDAEVQP